MEVLSKSRSVRSDVPVDAMLGDDVDFGRYILAVWRRRWAVVAAGLLCGLVAAISAWLSPPVYVAYSMLAVSGSKLIEQQTPIAAVNYRPLLENNSVVATVIADFQLRRDRSAGSQTARPMTPEVFFRDVLVVEEVRNSTLMRVAVRLQDPEVAAKVANRIADLAVEGAKRLSQSEAVQARDEVAVELAQSKKQLDEAAARLEQFRTAAQVELTRKDVEAILNQRGELLDLQADIAALRAKVHKGEAEIAGRRRIESLTKALDSDAALSQGARAAGESDKSILGLQLKSEEVSTVYDAIDEQLAQDRTELAALESRRSQLVNVHKLNARQHPELVSMYRKEAELARLTTEHEIAQASYKEIASKYDVARLQVASRSAQLQVIDRAVVPTQREPRHLVRNAIFALFAGVILMTVALILAEGFRGVLKRG